MQQTDNYELNLPEGSDLVNLLTDYNPNFETIDAEMKGNSIASIGTATELKSGTVHAITRANPDAAMFRFVATADWVAGDTVTVDTVQVTALLPNGEALGSGSYVINSNVLCCLVGTLLTVFVPQGTISTADNALKLGGELPEYYGTASDVQTATNVANAASLLVNQLNSNLTELQTLDFSQTSIQSGTSFNSVVQQLMNRIFPKSEQGTFNASAATSVTVNTSLPISKLRIVGTMSGNSVTWLWNSNTPNTITRIHPTLGTQTQPNPTNETNWLGSISTNSFRMNKMENVTITNPFTYYINEVD